MSTVPQSLLLLQITARLGATKIKLIVNTSTSVSIILISVIHGIALDLIPVSPSSANGEKIKCYRQANLEDGISSLRKMFIWTFMIADITNPLLGFDFLEKLDLIIDCNERTIYNLIAARKRNLKIVISLVILVVNEVEIHSFMQNIINKYTDIISPHKNTNKYYFGVCPRIDMGNHGLVYTKARQLSAEKFKAACSEYKGL